ncbi:unnamed protein product [Pieris brassicae]|uniref:Uncharacterized protein n=1 Tax=Pieris brassicae TaxID=7116 RepID=A0A9P0T3P7_PIEBR|nr:unnamed protein product [Pieris brassicae]
MLITEVSANVHHQTIIWKRVIIIRGQECRPRDTLRQETVTHYAIKSRSRQRKCENEQHQGFILNYSLKTYCVWGERGQDLRTDKDIGIATFSSNYTVERARSGDKKRSCLSAGIVALTFSPTT